MSPSGHRLLRKWSKRSQSENVTDLVRPPTHCIVCVLETILSFSNLYIALWLCFVFVLFHYRVLCAHCVSWKYLIFTSPLKRVGLCRHLYDRVMIYSVINQGNLYILLNWLLPRVLHHNRRALYQTCKKCINWRKWTLCLRKTSTKHAKIPKICAKRLKSA